MKEGRNQQKNQPLGSHLQSSPGVVALDLSCSAPDMVFAVCSVLEGVEESSRGILGQETLICL